MGTARNGDVTSNGRLLCRAWVEDWCKVIVATYNKSRRGFDDFRLGICSLANKGPGKYIMNPQNRLFNGFFVFLSPLLCLFDFLCR